MRRWLQTLTVFTVAWLLTCSGVERASRASSGHPPESACRDAAGCPFGSRCAEGRCVPAECSLDDPDDPDRPGRACPLGYACQFEDEAALSNGAGFCAQIHDALDQPTPFKEPPVELRE
jgi:hypothetical protein